ncbi:MAG: acyl-CoA dehydrogenase family protein [Actinomycetota bacterium]
MGSVTGFEADADAVRVEASRWFAENWDPELALGEWWQRMADAGWSFPSWPEGCGGRGLSPAASRAALRARREAGVFGPPNGVATFLTAPTLLTAGTEEQQRRYLPGIVSGQDVWCQLFSEPGSGSDMASLSTRAERDGDEWVINGQKVWNSGAQFAKYGILIARTDPDQPKHRGITYFLIDMLQDGVDVRPLREMTGDAAFNEVFMVNARVADSDRLGEQGGGWRVAMTTLSHERDPENEGSSGGGGAAFGEVDLSLSVAEYRSQVEQTIDGFSLAMSGEVGSVLDRVLDRFDASDDPLMRQRLAQLTAMRRTARLSGQRAAASMKAGGQPGPEVSTLKLVGSEIARRTRDVGLEAMGADGMLWGEDAPERGVFHSSGMFTPALSIAGGSDEVQHNIIGERVLGLPREPGEQELRNAPWKDLKRS